MVAAHSLAMSRGSPGDVLGDRGPAISGGIGQGFQLLLFLLLKISPLGIFLSRVWFVGDREHGLLEYRVPCLRIFQ